MQIRPEYLPRHHFKLVSLATLFLIVSISLAFFGFNTYLRFWLSLCAFLLLSFVWWAFGGKTLEWYPESPIIQQDSKFSEGSAGGLVSKVSGDTPPPYPNGWFMVMLSHDLEKGELKTTHLLGTEVVVFRGTSGQINMIDAYCSHLGAHLGEGLVAGDRVRCVFHAWEFSGDGTCQKIPYSKSEKIPTSANIRSWTVIELNNMILAYFDAEGRSPTWLPVQLPEIISGQFKYHGRGEHVVRCHIQEIPENGPDFVHLSVVHTSVSPFDLPGSKHILEGIWDTDPREAHIAQIRVAHRIYFFGVEIPIMNRPVIIRQVGPGLVWMEFDLIFGKMVITQAVTPISPFKTHVHHSVYSNMNRIFPKFVLHGTLYQLEQDIPIWNNKTFRKNPCLVQKDGPIKKFRRWYSQFYSENSNTVWKKEPGLQW